MPQGFRAPVLVLLTDSAALPITVEQLGEQLGLSDDAVILQTDLLTRIIEAVTDCVESWTKKDLITKTWEQITDCFPGGFGFSYFDNQSGSNQAIELRKSPFQSVVEVNYLSNDDTTTIVVSSDAYYIDFQQDYSRVLPIPNTVWPTNVTQRLQAIRVDFITGFGDTADDVPDDLIQAMLQHAAYFYTNRGDCSCSATNAKSVIPGTAIAVYDSHKIIWMAL